MPRKLTKRTASFRQVEDLVKKGYSANKIQKELQNQKLGFRRQKLLLEIRLIKNLEHTLTIEKRQEMRQKYTPIKYRKEFGGGQYPKKENKLYRMSFIIQDVPVHSTPFRRNYLGFRLNVFHINPEYLKYHSRNFKDILLRETSNYLGYDICDWENFDCYIGTESPTQINANLTLSGKWVFSVERDGKELYSKNGNI